MDVWRRKYQQMICRSGGHNVEHPMTKYQYVIIVCVALLLVLLFFAPTLYFAFGGDRSGAFVLTKLNARNPPGNSDFFILLGDSDLLSTRYDKWDVKFVYRSSMTKAGNDQYTITKDNGKITFTSDRKFVVRSGKSAGEYERTMNPINAWKILYVDWYR